MELRIGEKTENPLTRRMTVIAVAAYSGVTPSLADVKKEIARQLGKSIDLVVIKGIHARFGHSVADIKAYVYQDEKTRAEFEPQIGKKAKEKIDKKAKAQAEKKQEKEDKQQEKEEKKQAKEDKEESKPKDK